MLGQIIIASQALLRRFRKGKYPFKFHESELHAAISHYLCHLCPSGLFVARMRALAAARLDIVRTAQKPLVSIEKQLLALRAKARLHATV